MQEDYAAGLVQENTVYLTDFQSSGKGMGQNHWHSEAAKNLLFSIALRARELKPAQQFMLTKAVSLAVTDALSLFLGSDDLKIKWPNDIYYKDTKLAGILISNMVLQDSIDFSICGIGLNVNQIDFPSVIPNPISMKMIMGKNYDRNEVLNQILLSIHDRLNQLKDIDLHHFIGFEYLSRMYRLERWSGYLYNGEVCEARILGVDGYGQLIFETRDGIQHQADNKEIGFIL